MPRNYKQKLGARSFKNFMDENLTRAVKACRDEGLSIQDACLHGVKRGTLHSGLKKKHQSAPGRMTVFSQTEELGFVKHLMVVSEWGFPMDQMDVRYLAKSCLDKQGRCVSQFKENFPGKEWFKSFMQQQRNFVNERLCQNIKKSRAAVSVEEIEKYVKNLNEILKDLPSSNIVNYDETNLTDESGKSKCVFKRGVKYPERIMNSSKFVTSIMSAANSVGDAVPPYVVCKAEHLWDRKALDTTDQRAAGLTWHVFGVGSFQFSYHTVRSLVVQKSSLEITFQVIFPQMFSKHVKTMASDLSVCHQTALTFASLWMWLIMGQ